LVFRFGVVQGAKRHVAWPHSALFGVALEEGVHRGTPWTFATNHLARFHVFDDLLEPNALLLCATSAGYRMVEQKLCEEDFRGLG
jgi:hypothetical protein